MTKKIIGIIMLSVVLGGIFYATVQTTSLTEALIGWGIAILLAALIVLSVILIVGN